MSTHCCDHERQLEQLKRRFNALHVNRADESELYFIRCGGFVKIGVTINLQSRLRQIRYGRAVKAPEGLDLKQADMIAIERGSFEREKELHTKFAHLRHTGEWFTEAPELTDYITSLTKEQAA